MTEQSHSSTHLTHLDAGDNVRMVDVTEKLETSRKAIARFVFAWPQTPRLIETNQVSKGRVLEVAKVAAVMAAKQSLSSFLSANPCPSPHLDRKSYCTIYKIGVELEALTALHAATIAALTIYDMCKSVGSHHRYRTGLCSSQERGKAEPSNSDLSPDNH